jgi:hypothetical protein
LKLTQRRAATTPYMFPGGCGGLEVDVVTGWLGDDSVEGKDGEK